MSINFDRYRPKLKFPFKKGDILECANGSLYEVISDRKMARLIDGATLKINSKQVVPYLTVEEMEGF